MYSNINLDEPVENSLAYLFLAIYAGMLLDMLAFSGRSMNYFYMMTFLLLIYFIVRIILSNISRDLKKILFTEWRKQMIDLYFRIFEAKIKTIILQNL